MNFPFFVARRYLFAKKTHTVINIISMISVFGVATGTMALIIVLSIYNGFDHLIKSVYSTFDPDLKITARQGKVFDPTLPVLDSLHYHEAVELVCETLEENVLLEYEERMFPATLKGVPMDFTEMTSIDTMMREGDFVIHDGHRDKLVMGIGVAYRLGVGLNFVSAVKIFVPKRSGRISMNPKRAFSEDYIFPSGFFSIQQDVDMRYVLTTLDYTRKLLNYPVRVSALELKLKDGVDQEKVQAQLQQLIGEDYIIKNRYQQHELLYRVMKSEKWAIYMILTFILIVASFNIIGSLSMLIIDKKEDLPTFKSMGMPKEQIKRVFLIEGWMISIGGALIGIVLGAFVCWLQMQFGLIRLDTSGSFLIEAYPVKMQLMDFFWVFVTVILIGVLASWYPVQYFTKRYLNEK